MANSDDVLVVEDDPKSTNSSAHTFKSPELLRSALDGASVLRAATNTSHP